GPLLATASDACRLVVRGVGEVGVDRGGARLQPNARRPSGAGNGLPYGASRANSGLLDPAPIRAVVPAVNIPAGQVDHGVRAVDFSRPIADRFGIPADHPPRGLAGAAAEHHDFMAVSDERTGQQRTNLPASSRDNNLHVSSLRTVFLVESPRLQP